MPQGLGGDDRVPLALPVVITLELLHAHEHCLPQELHAKHLRDVDVNRVFVHSTGDRVGASSKFSVVVETVGCRKGVDLVVLR